MRDEIGQMLVGWLPGDTGAIAAGILIGGSEWLSFGLRQDLARVGLLHVVAASGYNVTVVGDWLLSGAVKTVGRRWGLLLAMAGIVGYLWLAGWSASVVRAGVMAILVLGAQAVGRKAEARRLLILTAIGMVAVRPEFLADIGWQLSVGATAGLIWIKPRIEEMWSGGGILGGDIRTSLAAQLATLPIIWHYFGNVSVVAPLVNSAVLWTIPLAMQICAVATVLGLVVPNLGRLAALAAWPWLAWLVGVAQWTARQPGSSWEVGAMSGVWVAAYYLILIVVLYRRKV